MSELQVRIVELDPMYVASVHGFGASPEEIAWQKLVHCHERHLQAAKRSVTKEQRGGWGLSDYSAVQLARAITGRSTSPSKAATRREIRERPSTIIAAYLSRLGRSSGLRPKFT